MHAPFSLSLNLPSSSYPLLLGRRDAGSRRRRLSPILFHCPRSSSLKPSPRSSYLLFRLTHSCYRRCLCCNTPVRDVRSTAAILRHCRRGSAVVWLLSPSTQHPQHPPSTVIAVDCSCAAVAPISRKLVGRGVLHAFSILLVAKMPPRP